jgi:REP element-mobilizing transposase RayT
MCWARGWTGLTPARWAWCLMGDHYHFVIETRLANLSLLMRHINGVFTQRFNQQQTGSGLAFCLHGGWVLSF